MGVFNSGVFKPRYMRATVRTATPNPSTRYNRGGTNILGSAPPPPPSPDTQYGADGRELTPAEISDRARAQGAAAGAASSLAAASQVGQANQKANANAMNTASAIGAVPASASSEPDYTLRDPGTLTPEGKAYRDAIARRLAGEDPVLKNAQQTADTQASRTRYMSRMGGEEQAAQARFVPGSLQYSRLMDNTMAGANQSALAGQNQVNDLARQRSAEALTAAAGIEKDAYGNAVGERNFQVGRDDVRYQRGVDARDFAYKTGRDQVADTQWQTTNTQNQEEARYRREQDALAIKRADEAIKRGDVDGAINAVQGAKAKNYLLSVKAAGGDVLGALQGMFENGTLKDEFRDATPSQDSLQAQVDFVKTIHPEWSDEQVQTEAIRRMTELDSAKTQPLNDAQTAETLKAVQAKMDKGENLSAADISVAIENHLIPPVNPATVPTGSQVTPFLKENPSGYFSINGEVYRLIKGDNVRTGQDFWGNWRHTSMAEVKDANGNTKYFYNGAMHDQPVEEWK